MFRGKRSPASLGRLRRVCESFRLSPQRTPTGSNKFRPRNDAIDPRTPNRLLEPMQRDRRSSQTPQRGKSQSGNRQTIDLECRRQIQRGSASALAPPNWKHLSSLPPCSTTQTLIFEGVSRTCLRQGGSSRFRLRQAPIRWKMYGTPSLSRGTA